MSETVVELKPAAPALSLSLPREISPEDWDRYRGHMAEILDALGLPLGTPGTRDTPERFLRALFEATSGYEGDPKLVTTFPTESRGATSGYEGDPKLVTTFPTESRGAADQPFAQIVEGPIAFSALCEHHALPFHGHAHVGYIAGDQIIGISKLTRLVRLFARRFTVQERLGEQIADTLVALVEPEGVAVRLEASHLCTQMRGVEEHSRTTTTVWRGAYRDAALRREFLDLAG